MPLILFNDRRISELRFADDGQTTFLLGQQVDTDRPFTIYSIGLNLAQELYQRINLRVDKMVEAGLTKLAGSSSGLDENLSLIRLSITRNSFPTRARNTDEVGTVEAEHGATPSANSPGSADPRIPVQITVGHQTAEIVNDILQIVAAKWQIV